MASTKPTSLANERVELGSAKNPLFTAAMAIGVIGLVVAILAAYIGHRDFSRFFFAYMTSYAFFLTMCLGALFLVLIHHLTRAGWSTSIRRIPEIIAGSTWMMLVLAIPIIIAVGLQKGELYRWNAPENEQKTEEVHSAVSAAEQLSPKQQSPTEEGMGFPTPKHETAASGETQQLRAPDGEVDPEVHKYLLNPPAFLTVLIAVVGIWAIIGRWYWSQSVQQDRDGDFNHSVKMRTLSAPLSVFMVFSLTLLAYVILMSLLPGWYSTMFGIYFFAGSAVCIFATTILIAKLLQKAGYLTASISVEHYHDLGKYLFCFTFFWGYIAFSQYMLLWYANIPEEVAWFFKRGASTMNSVHTPWSYVILIVLFCTVLIPFAALLSRHVKRATGFLLFWAIWQLVFHWVDMFWVVMPEYNDRHVTFGLVEVGCFLGIAGLFVAVMVNTASKAALRPVADPRLDDALAFTNI